MVHTRASVAANAASFSSLSDDLVDVVLSHTRRLARPLRAREQGVQRATSVTTVEARERPPFGEIREHFAEQRVDQRRQPPHRRVEFRGSLIEMPGSLDRRADHRGPGRGGDVVGHRRASRERVLPEGHGRGEREAELRAEVERVRVRGLDLVVRLDDHAFDGTVAIEVAVRAAGVTTVALHAKDLEFKGAASFAPSGEGACDIESTSTVVDKETMTVTFTFGSSLPEGRGVLAIDYVGELNNQMAGFYRSEYVNVKGESERWRPRSSRPIAPRAPRLPRQDGLCGLAKSRSTRAAACRAGTSREEGRSRAGRVPTHCRR